MKKKFFRKAWAGFLAMVLIAGALPTGLQPLTVHAADTVKTMNLDTSYLAPSDGSWDANDHKVYFGQYDESTTAFRILKADENTMMLDCDTILLKKTFDEDAKANQEQSSTLMNEWTGSDLEKWLNGTDYYGNKSVFTLGEQSAILETALAADTEYAISGWNYMDYAADDYVYLLSAKEANTLYADNEARKKSGGNAAHWWLRSAYADSDNFASFVNFVGNINIGIVDNDYAGVSPALNLNPASVIFASAKVVNKSSDTLTAVTDDSVTKEWKLTLSDSTKTVKVTDGSAVTQNENMITVPYTYTGSTVDQISVMITSGAYGTAGTEILYYGKLNTTLASNGTGTFTLPSGLPAGYKMYILAEDVNGENITDYASEPVEITVAEPVEAPTADLTENTYTSDQSVTLASVTAGADIYYTMTTDGSEPADPTAASTKYTGAISLTGTAGSSTTYKIKAVAVKSGMRDSSVSSFTYTISIPEATYEVIVTNGTGGGSYTAGASVTITAEAAPQGKQFKEWTGVDGLTFTDGTDRTSATAKFIMPANAVSVTATYEDIPAVDDTAAPSITAQPQNASVKVGETATFSVTATGTAPLSYQWMIDRDGKGFVTIGGATASSYTTSVVDKNCNGFQYKCVVTNAKGSAESNVAVLTVTDETKPEDVKYEITAGGDQTVKENFDGTVTITCNGELSKFVSVSVDGKNVDSKYYSLKSGSTILTFTKEYVNALSVGKHTVRFTYTDGYAETILTLKAAQTDNEPSDGADDKKPDKPTPDEDGKDEVPKTGDNTPIAWLFALMLISGAGLFVTHKKKAVRK